MAALALLVLALSGCSSAELVYNEFDSADDGYSGDGDGDGDSTGSSDTGSSDGDTGDGDGDEHGTEPTGLEDFGLELGSCDPSVEQLITYDLAEAQAEAAPVLVRESVLASAGVPSIPLSAQPFFNHFQFSYPPVEGPEPQIMGELWLPPQANLDAAPRYRLQLAIRGPQMSADQRTPIDLVIVVDTGPSMAGEPWELVSEALEAIESSLLPGDRVTVIGAGAQPQILIASTLIGEQGIELVDGLLAERGPAAVANVAAALELAYQTIEPKWAGQGQARVLLISNGHFQSDDALIGLVEQHAEAGRHLLTVGLGAPEGLAEPTLRALAAQGRGPQLYHRSADQLWLELQGEFTKHVIAVATDLEVTLSLPPGLAVRDRDQLAAKVGATELGVLGPDDTIVFHHELEACAELDPNDRIRFELAWTDPNTQEPKLTVWERRVDELGFGSKDTRKGAATVAYVRALRGYRDGRQKGESYGAVLDAISLIAEALDAQPDDPDLVEMSQVLGKLAY